MRSKRKERAARFLLTECLCLSMEMSQPPKQVDKQHEMEKKIKVHVIFDQKQNTLETTCHRFFSDVKYCFAIAHPEDCILVQKFVKESRAFVDISPFDIEGACTVRITLTDKPCQIQSQRSLNHDKPSSSLSTKCTQNRSIFSSSIEAETIFANFNLPQFSELVQKKLDCGRTLDGEDKRKIISDLGNVVKNLTFYPPVAQLFLVVDMFLKKYPYLVKDINPEIGKQSWTRQLQEYFVEYGIKVAAKKRKKKSSKSEKKKKNCQERYDGIEDRKEKVDKAIQTNLPPVYEDLSALILTMKKEWKKQVPDMACIEWLMNKTYQNRRNFILWENPKVLLLKERYPALFIVEEIKNEFCRCTGKNPFELFRENLKKFSSIIFDMPGSKQVIKNEIIRAQSGKKEIDARLVPILLIPSLLDENLDDFLCFSNKLFGKKEDEVYPWVKCNATLQEVMRGLGVYQIYIENVLVCEPDDLVDAVYCLIASYFIFNIEYTPKCLKSLQIFQTFFLEIDEDKETAIPLKEKVVKVIATLKRLQNRKVKKNDFHC